MDNMEPGTRVGKKVPEGELYGETQTVVDFEFSTVEVLWDGDATPRSEHTAELFILNEPRVLQLGVRHSLPTIPLLPEPPTMDLRAWWLTRAAAEVEPLIAKAAEYGGQGRALDLIEIGRDLHALRGLGTQIDDEEATELGIYFYMRGKFSRWTAAVMSGRRVSDDTLLDLGIYDRMAQRNREFGGWPK